MSNRAASDANYNVVKDRYEIISPIFTSSFKTSNMQFRYVVKTSSILMWRWHTPRLWDYGVINSDARYRYRIQTSRLPSAFRNVRSGINGGEERPEILQTPMTRDATLALLITRRNDSDVSDVTTHNDVDDVITFFNFGLT
ncbi:hypothetical protein QQF64_015805 [Cirrhinus molitorella]|uniref:Uncharacterized protein n=1 Tax=Cirrhinus molitorella TaxID=172907 RepID=A0ABR3LNC6_9TELE